MAAPRRARDARQLVAIFVTILIAVVVIGVGGQAAGARSTLVGSLAPDFAIAGSDGGSIRLSDYRGQPVWLSFFSSWCTRCRAENPDIEAVYVEQRRAGGDLAIIGIGVAESRASVGEYAGNARLTFPIGADGERAAARVYSVLALPTHVFIDRDGVVREVRVGALPPELMRALVTDLAARR